MDSRTDEGRAKGCVSDGNGGTDVATVNVTVSPASNVSETATAEANDGPFGIGAFGIWYLLGLLGMPLMCRRV